MIPREDDTQLQDLQNQPAPRQAEVFSAEHEEVRIAAEAWSGPLPDPLTLERYDSLVPGSAERFLQIFEAQVSHRHRMEAKESRRMDLGLAAAFIVVVIVFGGGIFLIFQGHDWAGAAVIGVNIVGLAALFISGTPRRRSARALGGPMP